MSELLHKKFSRREIVNGVWKVGIALVVAPNVVGCTEESPKIHMVELKDLISSPNDYLNLDIKTRGYPEYQAERKYVVAYPLYDPTLKQFRYSYSQVRLTTHRLHTEPDVNSPWFLATEQQGGNYLPLILFSTAPESTIIPKEKYGVTGTVKQDSETEEFFLQISGAENLTNPNK